MARNNKEYERDYKSHATTYDQQRFEGKDKQYLEFVRTDAFFALMPKDKSLKVLDVACGTGRGTIMLGQKGYTVTGIDYTQEMLDHAEKKKKELQLNNINFQQGSARELPFPDDTFNCVVSFNFMHMFGLEPQKEFIEEMTRVLKPGGTLIVEFDSYYKALFMGAIVQKNTPRTHLNKPRDLPLLFDNDKCRVAKIYGAGIPFTWRLFQHIPSVAIHIERLARLYPFKYLVERFFVQVIIK
jgi:ubiquinone/menaquinone biosynthesis C-methylase UbiE